MTLNNHKLSFAEKELAILREAVDIAEKQKGERIVSNPDVKNIINILEKFLKDKKLICYGGTAINNILPEEDQFYDKSVEIPDYDFYSMNALDDAKELADIYFDNGFKEVEAKAGVHFGTYKVFVNFIAVADITYLEKSLFKKIQKEAIKVDDILYAPVNFLRMNMYKELSRPTGDISRWEKVLKRLILLNKNYPLRGENCDPKLFQREFENVDVEKQTKLYYIVRNAFIEQGVVFFGGFASFLYSSYMPASQRKIFQKTPDFDVLSEDPEQSANLMKKHLEKLHYKEVKIIKHKGVGEIIPIHYSVIVTINDIDETVAFIYEPLSCHSYNVIIKNKKSIKVATIDTMLYFYFAFFYSGRDYYDTNRILCMAQYLFSVQQKNRLEQKGVLKRFTIKCYGKPDDTLDEVRNNKALKYKELKNKRNTREYELWFLRYIPNKEQNDKEQHSKSKDSRSKNSRSKSIDSRSKDSRSKSKDSRSKDSRSKSIDSRSKDSRSKSKDSRSIDSRSKDSSYSKTKKKTHRKNKTRKKK